MDFIGELAALATSFLFAMTALLSMVTSRMVGSQVTNRMRLTFALAYLLINVILFREPVPFSAESSRRLWLSLSGVAIIIHICLLQLWTRITMPLLLEIEIF